ncbi:MAG: DUF5678 domain-containing protein [Acidobacteriota bacterium]|nr:DUF5678 domain-containing protein [Acidobacteriota bacterium]
MSVLTAETILAQVNQLPAIERAKLIAKLKSEPQKDWVVPEGRIIRTDAPFIDRTKETEWLAIHRREYPGQCLALMGDQLIAFGKDAKEVFSKARELGYPDAIFIFVEESDLPFVDV